MPSKDVAHEVLTKRTLLPQVAKPAVHFQEDAYQMFLSTTELSKNEDFLKKTPSRVLRLALMTYMIF